MSAGLNGRKNERIVMLIAGFCRNHFVNIASDALLLHVPLHYCGAAFNAVGWRDERGNAGADDFGSRR
jgi:hypothetical protein